MHHREQRLRHTILGDNRRNELVSDQRLATRTKTAGRLSLERLRDTYPDLSDQDARQQRLRYGPKPMP